MMKSKNLNGLDFRVGEKSLSDIYPTKVREKIISDYKHKTWDEEHKRALANVQRYIDVWDKSNSSSNNLSTKEKLIKEENDSSLEFLNYCEKKFSEIKTTYDCILYQCDDGWNAVIDLSETVLIFIHISINFH